MTFGIPMGIVDRSSWYRRHLGQTVEMVFFTLGTVAMSIVGHGQLIDGTLYTVVSYIRVLQGVQGMIGRIERQDLNETDGAFVQEQIVGIGQGFKCCRYARKTTTGIEH
jgi:hypothetical protein